VRPLRFLGPAVLLLGLLTLAVAVSRGEANLYLIVIIPAVVGTGPLAFLGILLVFVGFFLSFFLWSAGAPPLAAASMDRPVSPMPEVPPQVSPRRRWGGVVFLGPIPLVFGSDPQMTRRMLVLGAVLFLALLTLTIALLLA
jgi:uncharacterized protein (TIGR00304 family)